jgi:hypothetical protein
VDGITKVTAELSNIQMEATIHGTPHRHHRPHGHLLAAEVPAAGAARAVLLVAGQKPGLCSMIDIFGMK